MHAGTVLPDEMWRHEAIANEPRIARPDDWFSPDEYVACKIWGIWTAARVIELGGGSPRTFMVCINQDKRPCKPQDGCASECGDRFWANVSRGNVLGRKDLNQIIENPALIGSGMPYHGILDYGQAEKLLEEIQELETRQTRP